MLIQEIADWNNYIHVNAVTTCSLEIQLGAIVAISFELLPADGICL